MDTRALCGTIKGMKLSGIPAATFNKANDRYPAFLNSYSDLELQLKSGFLTAVSNFLEKFRKNQIFRQRSARTIV